MCPYIEYVWTPRQLAWIPHLLLIGLAYAAVTGVLANRRPEFARAWLWVPLLVFVAGIESEALTCWEMARLSRIPLSAIAYGVPLLVHDLGLRLVQRSLRTVPTLYWITGGFAALAIPTVIIRSSVTPW